MLLAQRNGGESIIIENPETQVKVEVKIKIGNKTLGVKFEMILGCHPELVSGSKMLLRGRC
jgi:hypothetical protein